jgi:histidine triad (HIT) family protein
LENRDVTPMPPESPTDCIFCAIVNRQAPASIVHEDDLSLTFLDIRPVNPGHLLVVPKRHLRSLANLDESTGAHLFRIAMRAASALRRSGLPAGGINLFLADGAAAFQDVFHLHVIPRFPGDAFRITADWSATPSREEID